jgi:hypothetical protein
MPDPGGVGCQMPGSFHPHLLHLHSIGKSPQYSDELTASETGKLSLGRKIVPSIIKLADITLKVIVLLILL